MAFQHQLAWCARAGRRLVRRAACITARSNCSMHHSTQQLQHASQHAATAAVMRAEAHGPPRPNRVPQQVTRDRHAAGVGMPARAALVAPPVLLKVATGGLPGALAQHLRGAAGDVDRRKVHVLRVEDERAPAALAPRAGVRVHYAEALAAAQRGGGGVASATRQRLLQGAASSPARVCAAPCDEEAPRTAPRPRRGSAAAGGEPEMRAGSEPEEEARSGREEAVEERARGGGDSESERPRGGGDSESEPRRGGGESEGDARRGGARSGVCRGVAEGARRKPRRSPAFCMHASPAADTRCGSLHGKCCTKLPKRPTRRGRRCAGVECSGRKQGAGGRGTCVARRSSRGAREAQGRRRTRGARRRTRRRTFCAAAGLEGAAAAGAGPAAADGARGVCCGGARGVRALVETPEAAPPSGGACSHAGVTESAARVAAGSAKVRKLMASTARFASSCAQGGVQSASTLSALAACRVSSVLMRMTPCMHALVSIACMSATTAVPARPCALGAPPATRRAGPRSLPAQRACMHAMHAGAQGRAAARERTSMPSLDRMSWPNGRTRGPSAVNTCGCSWPSSTAAALMRAPCCAVKRESTARSAGVALGGASASCAAWKKCAGSSRLRPPQASASYAAPARAQLVLH